MRNAVYVLTEPKINYFLCNNLEPDPHLLYQKIAYLRKVVLLVQYSTVTESIIFIKKNVSSLKVFYFLISQKN